MLMVSGGVVNRELEFGQPFLQFEVSKEFSFEPSMFAADKIL